MWPECVNNLEPFPVELRSDVPADIVKPFREAGWPDGAVPVRLVKLLGTCTTDKYADCPTMPEWHIENSKSSGGDDYFRHIGGYFWCDFDLTDHNQIDTKLRMAFNDGDADCNDGTWGLVWDRDSGEVVCELTSVGDCEGKVDAVSARHLQAFVPHTQIVPTENDDYGERRLPFDLQYAHDAEFEKLIGVAMRLCLAHRRADG